MFTRTTIAFAASIVLGTASAALAETQPTNARYGGPTVHAAAGWHAVKHFSATEKACFDRASMQSTM
jgi:hypothetical protein